MRGNRQRKNRLPIPVEGGITLDELIARIQAWRSRPLTVREEPMLVSDTYVLSGLWLNTEHGDIVLHAPTESPLHREQFILHEMAHILLGHGGVTPDELEAGTAGHNNADCEREAEDLADYLAEVMRHPRSTSFGRVFG
jgi:Domain of unknown function (DUF955).